MSYDITIENTNNETVCLPENHNFTGGNYALFGTNECWLNVTYNYGGIFRRVLGGDGVNDFEGKEISSTIPLLEKAIKELGDAEPSSDYWEACDGNAKKALSNLKSLAELAISAFPDEKLHWRIS